MLDLDGDSALSCPSGYVSRQFVVFFFALLIAARYYNLGNNIIMAVLVFTLNTIAIIATGLSRIYGYHHTIYDELVSLGFAVVLVMLLLFALYYAARIMVIRIIDAVDDLIYKTNPDGEIVFANAGFARIMFPNENINNSYNMIIGNKIHSFWKTPSNRAVMESEMVRLKGRVSNYFLWAKSSARQEGFQLSVNSVLDNNGCVWGVGRDHGEDGTGTSGYYQLTVTPSDKSNESIITFCDREFARILKSKPEDIIGRKVNDYYQSSSDRDQIMDRIRTGDNHIRCYVNLKPNSEDKVRILVETSKYVKRLHGEIIGIIGTIRDVSSEWDKSLIGKYIIQGGRFVYVERNRAMRGGSNLG